MDRWVVDPIDDDDGVTKYRDGLSVPQLTKV